MTVYFEVFDPNLYIFLVPSLEAEIQGVKKLKGSEKNKFVFKMAAAQICSWYWNVKTTPGEVY